MIYCHPLVLDEFRNGICVPQHLQYEIIKLFHEWDHSSTYNTFYHISRFYYWRNLFESVKRFVERYSTCQLTTGTTHKDLLHPLPVPKRRFASISIDFVSGLPIGEGHNCILVVVDRLTKYGIFIPCTTNIQGHHVAH